MSKLWFDVGEHVICRLITEKAGERVVLDAEPTIIIYDPDGDAIELGGVGVDEADMPEADTGDYQYDFSTTARAAGDYKAVVTSVYSGRTTIKTGGFKLQ